MMGLMEAIVLWPYDQIWQALRQDISLFDLTSSMAHPLLQQKVCACLEEVMTHFMPIQTPMSLNATHAFDHIFLFELFFQRC